MIRPMMIADMRVRPEAVNVAFTSWSAFVAGSRKPTNVGVDVLDVSYEHLMADFFDRLLFAGGTVQDIKWLVGAGVMGAEDMSFWDATYARNVVKRVRS